MNFVCISSDPVLSRVVPAQRLYTLMGKAFRDAVITYLLFSAGEESKDRTREETSERAD